MRLYPADLNRTAIWSIELSASRGLGNRDLVLQLINHCSLDQPSADQLDEASAVVEQLRDFDRADSQTIATAILSVFCPDRLR
jgi:hypothetical protein